MRSRARRRVLGAHAELGHAAALSGVADGDAAAAALAAAGLLDDARPLAFAHPVVRTCILEDMTVAERSALHAAAAAAVAGRRPALGRARASPARDGAGGRRRGRRRACARRRPRPSAAAIPGARCGT